MFWSVPTCSSPASVPKFRMPRIDSFSNCAILIECVFQHLEMLLELFSSGFTFANCTTLNWTSQYAANLYFFVSFVLFWFKGICLNTNTTVQMSYLALRNSILWHLVCIVFRIFAILLIMWWISTVLFDLENIFLGWNWGYFHRFMGLFS